MPVRYDQDTEAKAIGLVGEHAGDYPSEYAAITAVAGRLEMTPETLREWIRQAAVDEGQAPELTTEASQDICEPKRKMQVGIYSEGEFPRGRPAQLGMFGGYPIRHWKSTAPGRRQDVRASSSDR